MLMEEVIEKRDIQESELYISVCIAVIEPRQASSVLNVLSEKRPLEMYGLRHLKRARKCDTNDGSRLLEVVVCPDYVEDCVPIDIKDVVISTHTANVCREKPQTRDEFKEWGEKWPVIFRPSEASEIQEKGLLESEVQIMRGHISTLLGETKLCGEKSALIVHPDSNEILMTSLRARRHLEHLHGVEATSSHALLTPTMLCIEGIAAVVRGDMENTSSIPITEESQYVCTGLDIYLSQEPEAMSAMALVHSRIRRAVYVRSDPDFGGLGSRYYIHSIKGLNHRFRVFRPCSEECSDST